MTFNPEMSVKPGPFPSSSRTFPSEFLLWGGLILISLVIAGMNLVLYGNAGATIGLVGLVGFLGLTILRPHLSLVVFVVVGLAIEQFPKDYAWTKPAEYFNNLGNIFMPLRGIPINPMEIFLTLIIAGTLLRVIVLRAEFVPIIAPKALILYLSSLVFFVGYGLLRGGVFLPALWEVRGIFYMAMLVLLVPQLIQTEQQVRHVVWAVIIAVGFRAIEISYHYISAGFSFVGSEEGWGSHEDAGWWSVTVVFCLALYVLKVRGSQRLVQTLLLVPILLAIVGSDRRTAYPVLGAALIFLAVLQSGEVQKRILSILWKVIVLFVIYLGVFWSSRSDSILLMPVKSIRESFSDEEAKQGGSYTSNLYREVEDYNIARMATEQPILGKGYGSKIDYYMPVPIMWDLGFFIAHNQILSVMAKTGIVGFIIFLYFYLSLMSGIGFAYGTLVHDPYFKAVLIFAGAAVTNHLLYGYFDITLTWYRSNIFLGTLVGLACAVIAIAKKNDTANAAAVKPPEINVNERVRWLLQAPERPTISTTAR